MRRSLFIFLFAILALPALSAASSNRVISDELVSNLRCDQLSPASIYKAVRPNAFDIFRRVTTGNFGANSIAHCWALARWQRIALLLGRQDASTRYEPLVIADMIRGAKLVYTRVTPIETPLSSYQVFAWPKKNLAVRWQTVPLDEDLVRLTSGSTRRSYQNEIESAQLNLFYRFSNLWMVLVSQSARERAKTLNSIAALANSNQLPMINLRFTRDDHHVVLVKSVKRTTKTRWELKTLDANRPYQEKTLIADLKDGVFELTYQYPSPFKPEIFLVGEEERSIINSALISHYQALCARP